MTSRQKKSQQTGKKLIKRPPSKTPEGEENRLIAKAYSLAEKQIDEGTASSQVITHFLKMGAKRETIERKILEEEVKLKRAKTEAIETMRKVEELYEQALIAMKTYSGSSEDSDYD